MNLEERLVKMLLDRNEKVSTAESCTGGLVAGKIVNVSGASEVFDEGYVTYANKSKAKLLGVSKEILDNEDSIQMELETSESLEQELNRKIDRLNSML